MAFAAKQERTQLEEVFHTPSLPAQVHTIGLPIAPNKGTVAAKKAAASGMRARGEAVADNLMHECNSQGNKLKMFLIDIADLDQVGRTAFRTRIRDALYHVRAGRETFKGTEQEAPFAATSRSAGVRVSEAVTFSKAIDLGFTPDFEGMTYAALIGEARVFKKGNAVGPTEKRGRKAATLAEKFQKFLADNKVLGNVGQLEVVAHVLMAARKEVQEPAVM